MENKTLVEVFATYGKGDGSSLVESYVDVDTPELRKDIVDSWKRDYTSDLEDFLDGKSNFFYTDMYGGDWDEPTGYEVVLTDYETKKSEIENAFKKQLEELNKQFGIK